MTSPARLDPEQGLVRGVRAAMLTVTAVGLAALAHAAVDDCTSVTGVLLATGLCWPAAVAMLGLVDLVLPALPVRRGPPALLAH